MICKRKTQHVVRQPVAEVLQVGNRFETDNKTTSGLMKLIISGVAQKCLNLESVESRFVFSLNFYFCAFLRSSKTFDLQQKYKLLLKKT